MNNKYIPTFGVEIHAELLTNTKAFSNSKVDFESKPNTNVNALDLAYPGTKPRVNKTMVEYAYRLANVLKMEIADTIEFDRKNYFYPDLPKGYQITQYYNPIGKNGKLTIVLDDGSKKDISITEIHMEEDTAKQSSINGEKLFDLNRAGVPLIEIVSGHEEFSSVEEVVAYVKQMREQLIVMGINDGKMFEGSFRVDVNVSIRKDINDPYGVRTEIKNLNSFSNITKALDSEIRRHASIIEAGEELMSCTVRFDEDKQMTVVMREKESQDDYNFIPEFDINPIKLTKELKQEFISKSEDKEISMIREEWSSIADEKEISLILGDVTLYKLFKDLSKEFESKKVIKFISNNIMQAINETGLNKFNSKFLNNILNLRDENKIDNKTMNGLIVSSLNEDITPKLKEFANAIMMNDSEIKMFVIENIKKNVETIKPIFDDYFKIKVNFDLDENQNIYFNKEHFLSETNLFNKKIINFTIDNNVIKKYIKKEKELFNIDFDQKNNFETYFEIIDNNSFIEKFKKNKNSIEKFLMGQTMKETKGKANPQNILTIIEDTLWN